VEDLPSRFARYLDRWLRPVAVATLDGVVSEHHHSHVLATLLAPREAIVEKYYDRQWRKDIGGKIAKARADIWCPSMAEPPTLQLYVEVKVAFLRDDTTDFLGIPTYGLARAAPSWADDIYRLLVGSTGPTHCAFILSVIGKGTRQFTRDESMAAATLARRTDVDADAIWTSIAALHRTKTSVDGIHRLVDLARGCLGARVTQFATRSEKALNKWYAPLLFEWVQDGAAASAYAVPP
jgi:hypothetical protein